MAGGGGVSGKLPRAGFRPGVSSSGKTSPWRETHPGVLFRTGPESGKAVKESKSGGKRGVLWSDFCIALPSNQKVLQAEWRLETSSPSPHLSSSQRTRCPGRQRVAGVPGDWRRLCFTGMRTGSISVEPSEVPVEDRPVPQHIPAQHVMVLTQVPSAGLHCHLLPPCPILGFLGLQESRLLPAGCST